MKLHGKIASASLAVIVLSSLAACGGAEEPAAAPAAAPAIVVPSAPAPSTSPGTDQSGTDQSGDDQPEVTEVKPSVAPSVAKTFSWVQIFSGPSDQDITPPADRYAGGRTVELNATANDQIGTYVADGAGMTLYRFDKDGKKSACTGKCAKTWPPLLIHSPGKVYPGGVDPQRISYIERGDGTCQVAIDGHPLYYYSHDTKPGQLNGQGIQGTWFASSPSGGRTKNLTQVIEQ
jgi:predicted lipoprotein with Yx(FWY)xxD motif